ncbi:MAG TPA: carboxypeptidase-like regulatory domain-containing protein [Cyclobacteriaceae bacterium]|nr:carboxypeptidase-like regulatory domain-containing protein [Cyclobacteriaceae bacterium]
MLKKVSILCLVLCSWFCASAQTIAFRQVAVQIAGVVRDQKTNEPVPFCNVYINNTTIGTFSNAEGRFELKGVPIGQHELVVSHVGYKTHARPVVIMQGAQVTLNIKLVTTELNEVVVTATNDDRWHKQLARFKKLFFGQEQYQYCTILNPWVLSFKSRLNGFTATASDPLEITNDFLGYSLTYTLKTFKFNDRDYEIKGLAGFTEMQSPDSAKLKHWVTNRNAAYRGSAIHLFKSMVDDQVEENGFELYRALSDIRSNVFQRNLGTSLSAYSTSNAIMPGRNAGEYNINIPYPIEVHYRKKKAPRDLYANIRHPVSWLQVIGAPLKVTETGVVLDPEQVVVSGYLADERIGKFLPHDFYPDIDSTSVVDSRIQTAELLERPYIHTDRSYFYAGETIWLKGYMKYATPILRDTLSGVVYVDLIEINQRRKIVTKLLPIDSGTFSGEIVLAQGLRPGNYLLRAYTRWMLNFNEEPGFTRGIRILNKDEGVRLPPATSCCNTDTTGLLIIHPEKTHYSLREKIAISFSAIDSLGDPVAANLSVAVTDITQSIPAKNEPNITAAFMLPFDTEQVRSHLPYDIQYGIDFSGTVSLRKKPIPAVLTVFDPDRKNAYGLITGDDGKFSRSLQFFDSTKLYIRATSFENKFGKVAMNKDLRIVSPKIPEMFEILQFDIFKMQNVRAPSIFNTAKVLDEVVITARKIEPPPPMAAIHGKGDYSLSGDYLRDRNVTDLLGAIQIMVPGVRIHPLRLAWNTGEPLVQIDGVGINELGDGQDLDARIQQIQIADIDHIDVIKYSMGSIYGSRGSGGVLAIFTRKGDTADTKEKPFNPRGLLEVKLAGYARQAPFESPDYSKSDDSHYLDYRSTIYWNSNVKTRPGKGSEVSFYAADVPTQYRIVVEGVTADGTPVHGERIITVE